MENEGISSQIQKEGEHASPSLSIKQRKNKLQSSLHEIDIAKSHVYAWIAIGCCVLVIAGIFLFISFKRNAWGQKEFAPKSMEFIVCIICTVLGSISTCFGIIRTIMLSKKEKKIRSEIKNI